MKKLLVFFLAIFLFVGCEEEDEKVLMIQLDQSTLEIRVTETYQFMVTHEPANLPVAYEWSSSNSAVATVSTTGLLTAVGEGSAVITVAFREENLTSTCTVAVSKQLATQITLNKETLTLEKEQSEILSYTLIPSGSAVAEIKWGSTQSEVASVDQNGKVTALEPGKATIIVRGFLGVGEQAVEAFCEVTVSERWATQITLNKEMLTLEMGQNELLSYILFPNGSVVSEVKWESTKPEVASVDQNGKVTALEPGKATVNLRGFLGVGEQAVNAFCDVTVVRPKATFIVLNNTEIILEENDEIILTYTSLPEFSLIESVVWSSSDESVATVDTQGKVTAKGEGTAVITVTDASNPEVKTVCIVTVPETIITATGVTLSLNEAEFFVGESIQLSYTVQPQGAIMFQSDWSSGNVQVAFVDQNGKVTGMSAGTAVITICNKENPSIFASCTIKVVAKAPTAISLDKQSLSMVHDESFALNVSFSPSNATPPASYYWSSNNGWVATVSQDGVVKALTVGTATIRVEIPGGLYATCTVTVEPVYNGWKEPSFLFGRSPLEVYMTETRALHPLSLETNGLAYVFMDEKGSKLQYCIYVFQSASMALGLLAFTDTDKDAVNEARGYCAERYRLLGINGSGDAAMYMYQNSAGIYIEAGFRSLKEMLGYQNLSLIEKMAVDALMNKYNLKDRWFIISYAR